MWVILFLSITLIGVSVIWLLYPFPIHVRIEPDSSPFDRYDDGAGHLPLEAKVRITNTSYYTVWFLGRREMPVDVLQQLVGGKWENRGSGLSEPDLQRREGWTPLRSMESITVLVGPVSENATEMRVGLAFTTERLRPTKAHWVFSPALKIVKRGQDYFAEVKEGSAQEVQILPLDWPPR
jgi:hypothetical protein